MINFQGGAQAKGIRKYDPEATFGPKRDENEEWTRETISQDDHLQGGYNPCAPDMAFAY